MFKRILLIACAIIFVIVVIFALLITQKSELKTDIFGGASPEETIALYVEAVENGEYATASRYYIPDKQEQEFRKFLSANKYDVKSYIEKINKPGEGMYSEDKRNFTLRIPFDGPDYFIRLELNQYNVWKIIEI